MGLPTPRSVEGIPGRGNSLIKGMELKDKKTYWGNLTGSAGPLGSRPGRTALPARPLPRAWGLLAISCSSGERVWVCEGWPK